MKLSRTFFAATAAFSVLLAAPVAMAADPVVEAARTAGVIGEQADGFLGVVPGQSPSANVRAHMDQTNIGRRAQYTSRAQERGVSVNEMAAATACQVFEDVVAVGQHYRDENGAWRVHSASEPVAMPGFCPH